VNALIIKNISAEGPGTIEHHLQQRSIPYEIVDLHRGDSAPALERFSHVVILGGPMAVYEMQLHPFLSREAALIDQALRLDRKVLGVCLGAQMLAHVLGAKVYPGGRKEVGWHDVSLTADGMGDPCMAKLSVARKNIAQVFQWHGDTFDLPQDAVRLASSEIYLNQAFRYSQGVYALQFHIEVTPEIVRKWLTHEQGIDRAVVDADSTRIYPVYRERAERFYRSFFEDSGEAD